MAALESSSSSPEVFPWLKSMPVAPEYHPSPAEFRDPIAYIYKIEKEASRFGICKIVPPVSSPARKTVLANLNRSLEARNGVGDRRFATRQQQIGFCPRRPRPVQRPVWQSGERYTFAEFEAKAKSFERGFLKKSAKKASSAAMAAMEIETMYWKATLDKPFSVEYANDMPGSAFSPAVPGGGGEGLAETAWNMRAVSRSNGSLLRFMKEEIPGVTSPMVYVAMLFSWFAWHVEDHDLHSLNYLHMGAGKTWYGVPREAAVAFEEVVRVQGYNAEINPLVTFSILGQKTTVMSPEVFLQAGVPCCRLVQNAGEFVVTFPRAYHTGFSHGFNCAEAANIATPEWLDLAKDAAIRRASINYPPMVSHFQLLYDLALALCSRIPASISDEPRSSRLKDKKKGGGETIVKEVFVQSVLENNDLLHVLGKGSPIVLLPKSTSGSPVSSKFRAGSQSRFHYKVPLAPCDSRGETTSSNSLISDDLMVDRKQDDNKVKDFYSMKGKLASLCEGSWVPSLRGTKVTPASDHNLPNINAETQNSVDSDGLSDHRLFSCVTCGILSFACAAIIKPTEPAARYLMSADCSFFNDWVVNTGVASNVFSVSNRGITSKENTTGGRTDNSAPYDIPAISSSYGVKMEDQTNELVSKGVTNETSSALGLLALNYGNSSDSDEDPAQEDPIVDDQKTNGADCASERNGQHESTSPSYQISQVDAAVHEPALQKDDFNIQDGSNRDNSIHQNVNDVETNDGATTKLNATEEKGSDSMKVFRTCSPDTYDAEATRFCKSIIPKKNENLPFVPVCDDSSKMHVFCLEHAVEVEQQLREIGGVHIQLLCHPEYPKIEAEAKAMAEELGISHMWNDITFREATKDDVETIQAALDCEEAMPKNGDWAVKLGINLFYSANLSRSPLYSKQMPYNSVIYNAFGRSSPTSSSARPDGLKGNSSRQRKVVAGKWCGKVWMSNQVHPLLLERDPEEEDDEEERGFNNKEPDVKPMRKSDAARKNHNTMSAISRKHARKRKISVGCDSKKAKRVKKEDCGDELSDAREHRTRSLTGKHTARNEARSAKKSKNVELEDVASDDFSDDSARKHRNSVFRGKKATCDDEVVSDDSLVGFSRLHKQILKSKRAKHRRREDLVSEDYLDCDSHRVRVTVRSNNQAKLSEHKGAASDDSLGSDSHLPVQKISKSKLSKFMEREDSAADNLRENNLRKSRRKTSKNNQSKSVDTEDGDDDKGLDEPVMNMKTRRSKLTKSINRQKIKVETPPRPLKRSSQKTVKQELQKSKQQTSRLRSNQYERGNSNSSAEEQEGEEGNEEEEEEQEEEEYPDSGPISRRRTRSSIPLKSTVKGGAKKKQTGGKKKAKSSDDSKIKYEEGNHGCDFEGCIMSFATKQELVLHKRNICPIKGCGKKFFSHKYLVQHRRVHVDDRPLRCPWKGCKMTFKWPWARTEHIRVHTGARPYICAEPNCGQTFRFVSDFSRHKRKTGHSVKKGR